MTPIITFVGILFENLSGFGGGKLMTVEKMA